ncbi:unnamed protein product [Camellia sinensis]
MFLLLSSADGGKMTNSKGTLVIGYNSSERTPATELIGSNVDILTEILTRVLAKFIIRFKCVSKDCALFSGLFINTVTSFDDEKVKSVSLHGQHQSLPTSSFLDGVGYGSGTCRIEDSCKGLLLCLNGPTCFIVCNLTTQKYTVLPYHSGTRASSVPFRNKFGVFFSSMFGGYLAFDPSKSPHYKVVLLSYIRNSDA